MNSGKVTFKKSESYPCDLAVFRDYDCILESGYKLRDFQIAYQTYGRLNEQRSNAILICHALTGDQFVAEKHPITNKDGWWSRMVGPGKPIDTNKYFIMFYNTNII